MRQCTICRQKHEQRDMLRVVRFEGSWDVTPGSLYRPGRGAYLCRSTECTGAARVKGLHHGGAGKRIPAAEIFDKINSALGQYAD